MNIAPLAAKAREALDRRKQDLWLVGDLAGEAAPPGRPGGHDDRLREFAEESGWLDDDRSLAALGDLRRTALTWSKPERAAYPSMSPWTARLLNGREDRLEIAAEAAASHPHGRVTKQAVRALIAERGVSSTADGTEALMAEFTERYDKMVEAYVDAWCWAVVLLEAVDGDATAMGRFLKTREVHPESWAVAVAQIRRVPGALRLARRLLDAGATGVEVVADADLRKIAEAVEPWVWDEDEEPEWDSDFITGWQEAA